MKLWIKNSQIWTHQSEIVSFKNFPMKNRQKSSAVFTNLTFDLWNNRCQGESWKLNHSSFSFWRVKTKFSVIFSIPEWQQITRKNAKPARKPCSSSSKTWVEIIKEKFKWTRNFFIKGNFKWTNQILTIYRPSSSEAKLRPSSNKDKLSPNHIRNLKTERNIRF